MARSRARQSSQTSQIFGIDKGILAIGGVTVAVIVLIIGLIMFNQSASRPNITPIEIDYPVGVNDAGQPFKGSPDAPIVLEEFADFRCPHCAEFYRAFKPLMEEYVKTGQVQLVFLNYPVLGQPSITTAQAAECALVQGPEGFWAYHDALFESVNTGESLYTRSNLAAIAEQIGLDSDAFSTCLNSNQQAAEVQHDINDGSNRGVTGTPSIFINGARHDGGRDTASLRNIFDQMLN